MVDLPLETARLSLRPMTEAEVPFFHDLVTRPEVARMLFLFHAGWTLAEARDFVADWAWTGGLRFRLSILESGEWRGWIGVSDEAEPEIFYALAPEATTAAADGADRQPAPGRRPCGVEAGESPDVRPTVELVAHHQHSVDHPQEALVADPFAEQATQNPEVDARKVAPDVEVKGEPMAEPWHSSDWPPQFHITISPAVGRCSM